VPDLTDRERLAFKYLAEGKRDHDIAMLLELSCGRIRQMFYEATHRLGAETRCHALAMLVKGGKL
jgi:DNA-binding NarL/FixJ family response regulator